MKTLEMRLRAKLGPQTKATPEKQLSYDMKWIMKKVSTGDLDLSKKSQEIKLNIAIKKNLVTQDKEGNYICLRN